MIKLDLAFRKGQLTSVLICHNVSTRQMIGSFLQGHKSFEVLLSLNPFASSSPTHTSPFLTSDSNLIEHCLSNQMVWSLNQGLLVILGLGLKLCIGPAHFLEICGKCCESWLESFLPLSFSFFFFYSFQVLLSSPLEWGSKITPCQSCLIVVSKSLRHREITALGCPVIACHAQGLPLRPPLWPF